MTSEYLSILKEQFIFNKLKKLETILGSKSEVNRVIHVAKERAKTPIKQVQITGIKNTITHNNTKVTIIYIKGMSNDGMIDISVAYLRLPSGTMIMTLDEYNKFHK